MTFGCKYSKHSAGIKKKPAKVRGAAKGNAHDYSGVMGNERRMNLEELRGCLVVGVRQQRKPSGYNVPV